MTMKSVLFCLPTLVLILLCVVTQTVHASDRTEAEELGEARLLSACKAPAESDAVEVVMDALADGAHIDVQDRKTGQTPLMAASLRGKVAIVTYLLEQGADVTIGENQGYTPAHGAGFQGRVAIMEALQKHGVDVLHDKHQDGFLPFHRACWGREERHTEVVEYMLDLGIDVNIEADDGFACIDMTRNEKTMELLMKRGSREPKANKEEL